MTMTEHAVVERIVGGEVDPSTYPVPVGWRILIEPIRIEETTQSGLVLPTQAIEAKEHLRYIGQVVGMGDLCYKHAKFEGGKPWCQLGDFVAYGAYAGQEVRVRDKRGKEWVALRLVNDDEILATIPKPEAILTYC